MLIHFSFLNIINYFWSASDGLERGALLRNLYQSIH
jgi:hypothetical protein